MPEGAPKFERSEKTPEQPRSIEIGEELSGIVFQAVTNSKGKVTRYQSSAPGRKAIVITPRDGDFQSLRSGIPYRIAIGSDSNPEDLLKGQYRAYILFEEDLPSPASEENSGFSLGDQIEAERRSQLSELQRASLRTELERVQTRDRVEREFTDEAETFGRAFFEEDPKSPEAIVNRKTLEDRAEHLRRSQPFQALADMLADPELRHEYDLMMSRKKEMLALQEGDERHRAFAPMIVALMMGERTAPLLNMAIDKTVKDRSAEIKEVIRQNPRAFVPEVIIGSGVHSAIYNLTRQMVAPDSPGLTIEREKRIGGQFAQVEIDLYRLNSRTRPMRKDETAIPGRRQTLNTLTQWAVTNPGDTGMEAYQHQSALADHARINLFLSGEPMVESEVRYIRKTQDGRRYIVEFVDLRNNRLMEIETAEVIFTTGLGEENVGFDKGDETTRNILNAEKEEYEAGGDAKVMSFSEVVRRLGDPSSPFPLKGFKNIVISGEGDSANVLAGIFLGYEGQQGMSTTQMDSIERITWIGQSIATKEEFIEECRARYHQLALEFPRQRAESYYGRINPIAERKVSRLERNGENIRVVASDPGYPIVEDEYDCDHYIYAHGFKDRTEEVLEHLRVNPFLINEEDMRTFLEGGGRSRTIKEYVGDGPVSVFFKRGDLNRVEFKTVNGLIEYTEVEENGRFQAKRFSRPSLFDAYIKKLAANISNIERIEPYTSVGPASPFVMSGENQGRPIASFYRGETIYKAGPAAGLSLTASERSSSQALRDIGENTAAVFRYAENTAALARYVARQRNNRISQKPTFARAVFDELADTDSLKTNTEQSGGKRQKNMECYATSLKEERVKVPYAMPARDILRFGLGSKLEDMRFGENLNMIKLRVEPYPEDAEGSREFGVTVETGVTFDEFDNLTVAVNDPHVLAAFEKISGKTEGTRKAQAFEITVPLEKGKVRIADISYTVSK